MNPLRPRQIATVVTLTAAWCALWGSISFANVAGGIAVGVLLAASGVGTKGLGGIRPVPLLHLIWLVIVDLVKSTVSVAYEILTPPDRTDESVIAVDVPPESRNHLLLLAVAITLTPGTAVVDLDPDSGTLYLHLLHHHRAEETVAHVHDLARLACDALPSHSSSASPSSSSSSSHEEALS